MARKAEELLPLQNLPPMLIMRMTQCFLRLTKRFHMAIRTRKVLLRVLSKNLPCQLCGGISHRTTIKRKRRRHAYSSTASWGGGGPTVDGVEISRSPVDQFLHLHSQTTVHVEKGGARMISLEPVRNLTVCHWHSGHCGVSGVSKSGHGRYNG